MKIKIDNEDELYNSFDKFEETLSEDLLSFINNKAEVASIKEKEEIDIDIEISEETQEPEGKEDPIKEELKENIEDNQELKEDFQQIK